MTKLSDQENADRKEIHLLVTSSDSNAVELLHRESGLSKQQIKNAMTKGAVWITRSKSTQRLRRAKRALQADDELHLYFDPAVLSESPQEPLLIDDQQSYSVWHKPYSLRSQGSKWGDHCTIGRWAEQHLEPERPAFTVHRLDRAATGLILIAHTKEMAATLAALFRNRQIEKRYIAVVLGNASTLTDPLRIDTPIDNRTAISDVSFTELSADKQRSLVRINIETGRKHQIRRHLAAIGHPIVGDRLHGSDTGGHSKDLQLNACTLRFHCPIRNEIVEYHSPTNLIPQIN